MAAKRRRHRQINLPPARQKGLRRSLRSPSARTPHRRREEGQTERRIIRRRRMRGPAAQNAEEARRGNLPRGPLSAPIEKRPPRARRPALPQPCAAVLSAKAGLTAGFGMGPGDPRLCGRARGGRSPAAQMYSSLPGTPVRGDPGGRMAGTEEDHASRSVLLIEDAKSSGY